MAAERMAVYVAMLEKARRETLAAAENVAPERRLYQLGEGRATPLWLMGHLGTTYNNVIQRYMFGQDDVMAMGLAMKFAPGAAGGKAPTANAEDYPPWEDAVQLYDEAVSNVIAKVATLDDAILGQPLPDSLPERLRGFFTDHGATLNQMVSHDAYHRGQLVMLGKA